MGCQDVWSKHAWSCECRDVDTRGKFIFFGEGVTFYVKTLLRAGSNRLTRDLVKFWQDDSCTCLRI